MYVSYKVTIVLRRILLELYILRQPFYLYTLGFFMC